MFDEKKARMEILEEQKAARRVEKESRWDDFTNMLAQMREEIASTRQCCEEGKAVCEGNHQRLIEDLQRQAAEQQELLREFSEGWRNEAAAQRDATLEAVRAMAHEQVPFNVQGYLDEFSKALAAEVRMLLGEVGKLREERKSLQHELGMLLLVRSKYEHGGEFAGDMPAPQPAAAEAPPPPPAAEQPPVRPGWRTVPMRGKKTKRRDQPPVPPPAPTMPPYPAGPAHMHPGPDPRHQVTSWPLWQPDPGLVPTPPSVQPTLLVPQAGSPGLFGPRSPRGSQY